jgi:hypothetical protein
MSLRPVYSVLLYLAGGLTGLDGFTPVTGAVTVIRDIELCELSQAGNKQIAIGTPSGGAMGIWNSTAGFAGSMFHWEGRVVCAQGVQVPIHAISGTWTVWISGYELPTP